jgi:hypothetical protein
MRKSIYLQNSMPLGEIDPKISNLQFTQRGVSKLRNAYVTPQGGIKKRHGTFFEIKLPNTSDSYKMDKFVFNPQNEFILLFEQNQIQIYKSNTDGSLSFTGPLVTTPYLSEEIKDLQTAQNGNLMIIVHGDHPPQELVFDEASGSFNTPLTPLPIKNFPAYDFRRDYYNIKFKLGSPDKIVSGEDLRTRPPTQVFSQNHVGGTFIGIGTAGEGVGVARISEVDANLEEATADIIKVFDKDFDDGDGTKGSFCYLGEKMWSDERGWPKAVAFVEDRLVLMGTKLLPQTGAASRIGSFNDFGESSQLDDDAFVFTLSENEYNEIKYAVSDKNFQIFCSQGIFTLQNQNAPFTPNNSGFRKQTSNGISDVKPFVLDNQTFFVKRGGKAVMVAQLDPLTSTYNDVNISITASHLINNPIAGEVLKGDDVDDAEYLFIINNDGDMVCHQSVNKQNISGWSANVTGDDHTTLDIINSNHSKFKQIVRADGKIYCIVERLISGISETYIERLSFDAQTDATITRTFQNPTKVIDQLDPLNGIEPRVLGDGKLLRVDKSVNQGKVINGQLTVLDEASNFSVGINFNVLVETMEANIPGLTKKYLPKTISRLFIDYFESIGIRVGGTVIPELDFNAGGIEQPVKLKSGFYTERGNNWGDAVTVQITQQDPFPFHITGLGYEVTE